MRDILIGRIAFLWLIFQVSVALNAQSHGDLGFSVVHFVPSKYYGPTVSFPNQRDVAVPLNTIVDYVIYSSGPITMTYRIWDTRQIELNLEKGKHYYFTSRKKELVDSDSIMYASSKQKKGIRLLRFEENLSFPIIPSTISSRSEQYIPSQGTGFLLNREGYVLTNFHVIDKAKKITVKGIHGDFSTSFEAQVVGTDSRTDLALLRINSKLISFPEPPYAFVPTKGVQQGETAFALGYPVKQVMGEEVKVTSGIINAKSGYKGAISEYQFSAAVQPGNSGGPLLNDQGQVIGMVTAKLNPEVIESVGYAVKADHLMFFLDQFEGVGYRTATTMDAKPSLPQVVSATSPFVYIIETE